MNQLNFYTNYGPTYVLYNIGFGGTPRNPDEPKALSFRCDGIRWLLLPKATNRTRANWGA